MSDKLRLRATLEYACSTHIVRLRDASQCFWHAQDQMTRCFDVIGPSGHKVFRDSAVTEPVVKRFDTYLKVSNDRLAHYVSKASTDADEQRLIKDMQYKRDAFLHDGVDPALAALKAGDKAAFQQLQAHKLSPLYSSYEKA